MESTMATQRVYDIFNDEGADIDAPQISVRQYCASSVRKEIDGNVQQWFRYDFLLPINHGLARQFEPLPGSTEVRLKYQRASAGFSIMKLRDTVTVLDNINLTSINYEYPDAIVPIVKPVFRAMYLRSDELDQKMRQFQQYAFELDYFDYVIRKPVLADNESDFTINLTKGKMPKFAVFALAPLARLVGSQDTCLTKFDRHNLTSFDVLLDNNGIEGFPLKTNADFYHNFLVHTDRYMNPWSSGVLPLSNFMQGNFFIVVNFENLEREDHSHFHVKLSFSEPLAEKFVLLYMPITQRTLTITPDGDVRAE